MNQQPTNYLAIVLVAILCLIALTPVMICGGCMLFVGGTGVVADNIEKNRTPAEREAHKREMLLISAETQAEKAVRRHLKSPSSADFDSWTQRSGITGAKATVAGEVEAKNSFGVTLRQSYLVIMRVDDRGEFTPAAVQLGDQTFVLDRVILADLGVELEPTK